MKKEDAIIPGWAIILVITAIALGIINKLTASTFIFLIVGVIYSLIIGFVAGYVTNNIAIIMIFRKVRFLFIEKGGLVLDRYDEFKNEISKVVEKHIINQNTLEPYLTSTEFADLTEELLNQIFTKSLPLENKDLLFSDIPDINLFADNILKEISNISPEIIQQLILNIREKFHVSEIITDQQLLSFSSQLIKTVSKTLKDDNFIKNALQEFSEENLNTPVMKILPDLILGKIFKNLESFVADFSNDLRNNFSDKIKSSLLEIYTTAEFDKALIQIQDLINELQLSVIFNLETKENLSTYIKNTFIELAQSEYGSKLIKKVIERFYDYLKNSKVTIYELFPQTTQEMLTDYLRGKLPSAIEIFVEFIENYKEDFENLFNQAIKDSLDENEGLADNIRNMIKGFLLGSNAAERFGFIGRLIAFLRDSKLSEENSVLLSDKIINYFEKTTLNIIISDIERLGFFKQTELIDFAYDEIISLLKNSPDFNLNKIFDKKISEIYKLNIAEKADYFIKNKLVDYLLNTSLYSPKTNTMIINTIDKLKNLLSENTVSSLITSAQKDDLSQKTQDYLLKKETLSMASEYLMTELHNNIKNADKNKFLNDSAIKQISEHLTIKLCNFLKSVKENFISRPINLVIRYNNKLFRKISSLKVSLINYSLKHKDEWLSGKVEKLVRSGLSPLKADEIKEMVQLIMGREMKPLTWLGGIMGFLVGAIPFLAFTYISPLKQLSSVYQILSLFVVLGFIGWLTNLLAIKGIFWPYNPVKIFKWKFGLIPGKKDEFAQSMSDFIINDMLNEKNMQEMYSLNHQKVSQNLSEYVAENNFTLLNKLISDNLKTITEHIVIIINKEIDNNQDLLAEKLVNEIGDIELNKININNVTSYIKELLRNREAQIEEIISQKIFTYLQNNNKLSEYISETDKIKIVEKIYHYSLSKYIAQIEVIFSSEDSFKESLLKFDTQFNQFTEKSLEDIIGTENTNKISLLINDFITNLIKSEKTQDFLVNNINSLISENLSVDKPLNELMKGQALNYLHSFIDISAITVLKMIEKKVQNEKTQFAAQIKEMVKAQLGFFYSMANGLLDIEQTCQRLAHNLCFNAIPSALNTYKTEIQSKFHVFVDKELSQFKLSDAGFYFNKDRIRGIISQLQKKQAIYEEITYLSNSLTSIIFKQKFSALLKKISINCYQDFLAKFSKPVHIIYHQLSLKADTLISKSEKLTKHLIKEFIDFFFLNKSLKQTFLNISQSDLKTLLFNIKQLMQKSQKLSTKLDCIIKTATNNFLQGTLSLKLNMEDLQQNIKKLFDKLSSDKQLRTSFNEIISNPSNNFINKWSELIPAKTVFFTVNQLSKAIAKTTLQSMYQIIHTLKFSEIVVTQVQNMHGKVIKEMFDAFAGSYFKFIIKFGFWGALLAFSEVMIVLTAMLLI